MLLQYGPRFFSTLFFGQMVYPPPPGQKISRTPMARPGSALTCLTKEGKLEKINNKNILIV